MGCCLLENEILGGRMLYRFPPQIPQGYIVSSIIVAGSNVTDSMIRFGHALRTMYGKQDTYRRSDFTINYLG